MSVFPVKESADGEWISVSDLMSGLMLVFLMIAVFFMLQVQDTAVLYDDLRSGFEHHFLQPCYIESESVESNGRSFQAVEALVKANPDWRLSLQTHKWMGVS